MNDATDAGRLLLKLYELRTEPALRQARAWFAFAFHPDTAQDVLLTWLGPGHESAPYRMVTTYWDMAAALVTEGAIPATMFNALNTEHFALYAKLRPFLPQVRAAADYPDYLEHVEKVVHSATDSDRRINIFTRYLARQRTLAEEGRQRAAGDDVLWTLHEPLLDEERNRRTTCSFCGRPRTSDRALVYGPTGAICRDCVRSAAEIVG